MSEISYKNLPSGVYCIRNIVNNKKYVGSAVNLTRRLREHKRGLRNGNHKNKHLQAAWNKYGEACFEFNIIGRFPANECIKHEQVYIDKYRSAEREYGYNACPVADSKLGFKHSEETKNKLSSIVKKHWEEMSPEERQRQADLLRDRIMGQEGRMKISKCHKGVKRSTEARANMVKAQAKYKGRKHTPETIEKLKAAWVRRKLREPSEKEIQGRIKVGKSHLGKTRSKKTREKMSRAQKGRVITKSHREKIAATLTGKPLSEKHKQKIRDAARYHRKYESHICEETKCV